MHACSIERQTVRVWQLPVRLIHWLNFGAILALTVTGAYIHWPFLSAPRGPAPWLMGWMRLAHFVCGWGLMIGLVVRWWWSFVGNKYSNIKEFFPVFYPGRRRDIVQVFRYYAFLSPKLPPHLGHNALAAVVYLLVFVLLWFQVVTGFALFSQYDPQGLLYRTLGHLFSVVSSGWVRLLHYGATWVFGAFFVNHIYSMWISDIAERDGTAGSIFSGYKYGPIEEFEDADHRPWQSLDERRRARAGGPGKA